MPEYLDVNALEAYCMKMPFECKVCGKDLNPGVVDSPWLFARIYTHAALNHPELFVDEETWDKILQGMLRTVYRFESGDLGTIRQLALEQVMGYPQQIEELRKRGILKRGGHG